MPLGLGDYRRNLERCLVAAEPCWGETAILWRHIADSYRILINLEEAAMLRKSDGGGEDKSGGELHKSEVA